ncbi:MAG: dihydroorotate dehydrogenase electron transfer subunit [Spirochaetaceae bacterium]|jgi:NAD(P)H-flavin reductase|nr:dihydroorotate dehydrogenase electron transfer subunit [Spirochaetaceae bacterium]
MQNRECRRCKLAKKESLDGGLLILSFAWSGPVPRAGQFFLMRPLRTRVFLARPISLFGSTSGGFLRFLIALRGRGTEDLAAMGRGEEAELTGPLGNAWGDMALPAGPGPVALVGGGIGIAPLAAFAAELAEGTFDFYAGFKSRPFGLEGLSRKPVIATEDGSEGSCGRIPDFMDPAGYRAVYACGPEPMLQAVAASCSVAGVPCFVSLERRMACGVGACLGCTVETAGCNRRCCADGPIFSAGEVFR